MKSITKNSIKSKKAIAMETIVYFIIALLVLVLLILLFPAIKDVVKELLKIG